MQASTANTPTTAKGATAVWVRTCTSGDEGRVLQAKYELIFDLEAIEKQLLADGTMVRGRAGQTVYLDLSEPDSVVYYDGAGKGLSISL